MIDNKLLLEVTRDLNVLYVEDDEDLSLVTKELLNLYFKSVEVAYNGKEGLKKYNEYYIKNDIYYDIVLTDINMPVLNGIEMSRDILLKNEAQSIIIITAYNSTDYLKEAINLGVDGFISKPMDSEQLFRTIFKVSRLISNQKMIDKYIQQIEDLNISLEQRNSELEKSTRMLDTVIHKDKITKTDKKTKNKYNEQEDIKNQILDLVNNDLFELKDILIDIDVSIINIINNLDDISKQKIDFLIKYFSKYAAILHYYTFFNDLSIAMTKFADTMRNTPLPEEEESIKNVFIFLETFIYVLTKWQNDISSGDESKLNQLDASIISDMDTITNMWTQKQEEVGDEDLDDIFDF